MDYESTREVASKENPGVVFRIVRMSLQRRIELGRRATGLLKRSTFLKAGPEALDHIEAAVIDKELERLYIEWGLASIAGLTIDGQPADAMALVERGPEALVREVLNAVRTETGLTEIERKN
ncbi:MAG: hypothetical protein R2729_01440 [Bryobacteraceae bacterium]